MARPKKSTTPPSPQDPKKVKHGCVDCHHMKSDIKAFPCRECRDWNYWQIRVFRFHPMKSKVYPLL